MTTNLSLVLLFLAVFGVVFSVGHLLWINMAPRPRRYVQPSILDAPLRAVERERA